MTVEDQEDMDGLVLVGRAVAEARDEMLATAGAGVTTAELDAVGREVLARHGATPAPPTVGFPAATCVSVNDEAAHGIPSARRLVESDLVNVDVSAELNGYWADTGASTAIGSVPPMARRLLETTRSANRDALAAARDGKSLRHMARAVQRRAGRHGLSVIRNLCGHGTGRDLHEKPSVASWPADSEDLVLWDGLVLAVEPFLSTGAIWAELASDGWTLRTPGHLSAQFEHTVVITAGKPAILTA